MKGLIRKSAAALGCLAGVGGLGCYTYHDLVDPCYPERYNYQSRQEEIASYTPQERNGHVLDQTVWNTYFEAGTDKLNGGGLERLAYLARRRPQPDPVVFLQAAQDVNYDPAKPDELADRRQELDAKRVVTVQRFLNAQTGGSRGEFQVLVHDPAEVSVSGKYADQESKLILGRVVGGLPAGGAGGAAAGGAAAGGAATGGAAAGAPVPPTTP